MAVLMFFVSAGFHVNFHYCTENEHLVSSFGDASQRCEHCLSHSHQHMRADGCASYLNLTHFDSNCCCKDLESRIQFTHDYTFTPEKQLPIFLNAVVVPGINTDNIIDDFRCNTCIRSPQKIPFFASGREMAIFFSSLRLDPPVC